ncbi:Protein nedd1 [Boothiomyces sp. JEL0838]|nr:Protein nedd1 [Boothiomyces sp. JEL0838]
MFRLAASSKTKIQVYEIQNNNHTLIQAIDKEAHSISWSPDNQSFVATLDDSIILSDLNDVCPLESDTAKTSSFGWKSNRYLYYSVENLIKIYDTKDSKIIDTITAPSIVTCIAISYDDSRIACGLESGEIFLFSLKHKTGSNLKTTFKGRVGCLAFYPFKKSILVAGGHDGSVACWDINSKASPYLVKENAHSGPVTGVAFAPCNKHFYCTIGLDKSIHYHESTNTTSKGYSAFNYRFLHSYQTDSPLISISINDDHIVAVGNAKGQILLYDIRTKKLQHTIQTDSPCSISSLAFQPPKWAISACQKDGKKPEEIKKSTKTFTDLKRPESVSVKSEEKTEIASTAHLSLPVNPKNPVQKSKSGEFMDMFSPLTKMPNAKSVPDLKTLTKSEKKDHSDAVSTKSFGSRLQKTFHSKSHESLTRGDDKSAVDKHEKSLEPKTPMEKSPMTPSENRLFTRGSLYRSAHIPNSELQTRTSTELSIKTPTADLLAKTPMGILKKSGDVKEEVVDDDLTKFNENFTNLSQKVLSDTINRVSDDLPTSSFQYKLIRNVVDEVLKENLSAIHRDIQNMHLELIKQFQNQKVILANVD